MAKHQTKLDSRSLQQGLERLRRQAPELRRRTLARIAEAINSEAQTDAPVKTGFLKESHIVDLSNPDAPRIGATAQYAAAVHANHETKAGWYQNAIVKHAARIFRAAGRKVLSELNPGSDSGGGRSR